MMVDMLLAFLLVIFLLPFVLMPEQILKALKVGDDTNRFGLHKINLVALGIPVHESGPPICMAKLIMLRHKINQSGEKRRSRPRHTRSPSRTNMLFPQRPRTFAWMKFGKQMR